MKYKNLNKYIFSSFLLFSSSAMAKSTMTSCEIDTPVIVEVSRCLDGIKEQKERELQTWINNQTFILEALAANNGRHAALNMFKRSQRNFISYRENNCRWQYLVVSPAPGAAVAFKKCFITLTQDRIEELSKLNGQKVPTKPTIYNG